MLKQTYFLENFKSLRHLRRGFLERDNKSTVKFLIFFICSKISKITDIQPISLLAS